MRACARAQINTILKIHCAFTVLLCLLNAANAACSKPLSISDVSFGRFTTCNRISIVLVTYTITCAHMRFTESSRSQ